MTRTYRVTVGNTRMPSMSKGLAERTARSARKDYGLTATIEAEKCYRVIIGKTRMPAMSRELAERTAASARQSGLDAKVEEF